MQYASFGSVSSGTMRPEDLIPAFADTLDSLLRGQPRSFKRKAYRQLIWQTRNVPYDSADADEILSELFDRLNDFAPPYAYFGAHPGDGAAYGFWLGEDFQETFRNFGDGLEVSDTSEVPADYTGEVLHVNDPGNMTLYVARRGKLTELWSLV